MNLNKETSEAYLKGWKDSEEFKVKNGGTVIKEMTYTWTPKKGVQKEMKPKKPKGAY